MILRSILSSALIIPDSTWMRGGSCPFGAIYYTYNEPHTNNCMEG